MWVYFKFKHKDLKRELGLEGGYDTRTMGKDYSISDRGDSNLRPVSDSLEREKQKSPEEYDKTIKGEYFGGIRDFGNFQAFITA